jgi:hypothetical protein
LSRGILKWSAWVTAKFRLENKQTTESNGFYANIRFRTLLENVRFAGPE